MLTSLTPLWWSRLLISTRGFTINLLPGGWSDLWSLTNDPNQFPPKALRRDTQFCARGDQREARFINHALVALWQNQRFTQISEIKDQSSKDQRSFPLQRTTTWRCSRLTTHSPSCTPDWWPSRRPRIATSDGPRGRRYEVDLWSLRILFLALVNTALSKRNSMMRNGLTTHSYVFLYVTVGRHGMKKIVNLWSL